MKLGVHAVRHQTCLDQLTISILHRLTRQAEDFLNDGQSVSHSTLIRYAVVALLNEEAKVWSDMGKPDQEEVRRLLREARVCRPCRPSSVEPPERKPADVPEAQA